MQQDNGLALAPTTQIEPKYSKEVLLEQAQTLLVEVMRIDQNRLFRQAYALTGNADDAQDALQFAFAAALPRALELRTPSGFLNRTVRNYCLEQLRIKRRQVGVLPGDAVTDTSNHTILMGVFNSATQHERNILNAYLEYGSAQEVQDAGKFPINAVKRCFVELRRRLGVFKTYNPRPCATRVAGSGVVRRGGFSSLTIVPLPEQHVQGAAATA